MIMMGKSIRQIWVNKIDTDVLLILSLLGSHNTIIIMLFVIVTGSTMSQFYLFLNILDFNIL